MENAQPTTPEPKQPQAPNEGQSVKPNLPKPEINTGKVGNGTEVDLDKGKTQTYPNPKTNPPERH